MSHADDRGIILPPRVAKSRLSLFLSILVTLTATNARSSTMKSVLSKVHSHLRPSALNQSSAKGTHLAGNQ